MSHLKFQWLILSVTSRHPAPMTMETHGVSPISSSWIPAGRAWVSKPPEVSSREETHSRLPWRFHQGKSSWSNAKGGWDWLSHSHSVIWSSMKLWSLVWFEDKQTTKKWLRCSNFFIWQRESRKTIQIVATWIWENRHIYSELRPVLRMTLSQSQASWVRFFTAVAMIYPAAINSGAPRPFSKCVSRQWEKPPSSPRNHLL